MYTWLVHSFARFARTDYILVVVVFSVVVLFGFMQSVVAGMVPGLLFFAYNYSRVDVVARILSGADMRSRVSRPPPVEKFLRRRGGVVRIVLLEGISSSAP